MIDRIKELINTLEQGLVAGQLYVGFIQKENK